MGKVPVFDQHHYESLNESRRSVVSRLLVQLEKDIGLATAADVGCGLGYFSELLQSRGLRVSAVDGREQNVSEGRARYQGINFIVGDIENPAILEIGIFDLVLCFGLLYHLENPLRAIRNLCSLTEKVLLVESMCAPGKDPRMELLDEFEVEDQGLNYVAFYPTEACLVKMFYRAGFSFVYGFAALPDHEDFRETEKKLGADVGLLSDVIAIELIDLAGCKRPAIIDARGEFVFEIYVSSLDMQTRLPAFASDYLGQHEHPIVVADLSLVPGNEGTPRLLDEAFGPQVERLISRASLEREVVHRIWNSCEPLLDQKYPDRHTWRFARALFFRRRSSMKKIARRHLQVWEKMQQPELYAAYMLKEDFLNIWQGQAKSFSEDRFDAWIQRAVRHSNLRLDALVSMMLSHRRQILAFSRRDFLDGFYKRLSAITSLDKNRSARSFSAARAALLMRGLSQEKEKLAELVGQFADELKGIDG